MYVCVCVKNEQNKVVLRHKLLCQHHKLPRESFIFELFFQLNEIINVREKEMGGRPSPCVEPFALMFRCETWRLPWGGDGTSRGEEAVMEPEVWAGGGHRDRRVFSFGRGCGRDPNAGCDPF